VFLLLQCKLTAQYKIPYANKNSFSVALIDIFNDAPSGFKQYKGGNIFNKLIGGKSFKFKMYLPNAIESKIIVTPRDSFPTAVFVFAKLTDSAQAEAAFIKHLQNVYNALGKKILLRVQNDALDTGIVRATKIGYILQNGFFYYNAVMQMQRVHAKQYLVRMLVKGTEPTFYYWIQKNNPHSSNIFVNNCKKSIENFENSNASNCFMALPGFTCELVTDSTYGKLACYYKIFPDILNAQYEFDNALGNLRSSLGKTYVYKFLPSKKNVLISASFVMLSNFEEVLTKQIVLFINKYAIEDYRVTIKFLPAVATPE